MSEYVTLLTEPVTGCCGRPYWQNRCSGCGHRQPVRGVPPVATRYLALRRPWVAYTELRDRRRARRSAR